MIVTTARASYEFTDIAYLLITNFSFDMSLSFRFRTLCEEMFSCAVLSLNVFLRVKWYEKDDNIWKFLALSCRVSCINSLTSPTVLLWPIHDYSHKYLYQLAPTCEQKPIGKTQHIYERRTHETKMDEFDLRRCSTNSFQALHLPGKMYAFLVPPCQKTFLKTTDRLFNKNNT